MITMRRSKGIYLLTVLGMIAAGVIFSMLDGRQDIVRVHQHREQPGTEALGECTACQGNADLCTHLPVIVVETNGQKIPGAAVPGEDGRLKNYEKTENGEEEITVSVDIIDRPGVYHHPEDEPDVSVSASFRIRGNTSRYYPKSNYRMKLTEEENPEKNKEVSLLGMEASSEWALHGPYMDRSQIRNYLCMNLSAEVLGYAPDVRFCELMVNGEYRGVYLLMETVREGAGRIDLTDYEQGDLVFSYITRLEPQHVMEGEPENLKILEDFESYTLRHDGQTEMEIVYPGASDQTQEVKDYVAADLSEIERWLYSREMEMNPDSCWEYLDMESFADYYILQEFFAVNDIFSASTYFYKDVRGKLHIGPVWDYNNAVNNYLKQMPATEFLASQRGWYGQLMKSERFVNYVIARYRYLREGVLSQEYMEQYIQETVAWLGGAVDRNFEVWGYTFDVEQLGIYERQRPFYAKDVTKEAIEELNPENYEEALEFMEDYLLERGKWMDRAIESLRQYCHPSRNANDMFD